MKLFTKEQQKIYGNVKIFYICKEKPLLFYMNFTVPIKIEVTRIDKNGEETIKNICYILQFIDSARFMVSSLSNLVNHLSEGIHGIKFKYEHE